MNGAQAILESLRREEVDIVFGYPGGAVLDMYLLQKYTTTVKEDR